MDREAEGEAPYVGVIDAVATPDTVALALVEALVEKLPEPLHVRLAVVV